jgi:hypothetical protein
MTISNYTVVENHNGGRAIGYAGSIPSATDIALRHFQTTGKHCYVTEWGQEISGKTLFDTRTPGKA